MERHIPKKSGDPVTRETHTNESVSGPAQFSFTNTRKGAVLQRKYQQLANNSRRVQESARFQQSQPDFSTPKQLKTPPEVDFSTYESTSSATGVAQMKWIDDDGPELRWDQVIDGVQWFYNKGSGKMYYTVVSEKDIKLGDKEAYLVNQDKPKAYGYWKDNSVLDLDVMEHLDPSVIPASEAVPHALEPTTGMEAQDKGEYLGDVKAVETGWGGGDPNERAAAIISSVNKNLTRTGAPPVTFTLVERDADSYGQFCDSTWNIELNSKFFTPSIAKTDDMAQIADTVFHEARHAEQFYRVARLLAGLGFQKQGIQHKMTMDGKPVNAHMITIALQHPMHVHPDGLSTEVLETLHWYQSLYGGKSLERIHTIRTMKEAKLAWYKLFGQFQALKSEAMGLKFDIENIPFEREEEQRPVIEKLRPIMRKLQELGDVDTQETQTLGQQKAVLEGEFKLISQKFRELFERLKEQRAEIIERQKTIIAQSEEAMKVFEHWQELYKQLPEELDAWRIGGSIQDAYRLL